MHVDRTRFLVLTAALSAAAGCDQIKSNVLGSSSSQAPAAADPAGAPPELPQPAGGGAAAGKGAGTAQPHGTAAAHPTAAAIADPASPTGWGVAACSADSVGSPGDCGTLKGPDPASGGSGYGSPGAAGAGGSGYGGGQPAAATCNGLAALKTTCDRVKGELKAHLAEKAVGCMLAANGTKPICDQPDLASKCIKDAVNSACVEPAAIDACNTVASGCGWQSPGIDACQHELSSVASKTDRAKMVVCMQEGCDAKACAPN